MNNNNEKELSIFEELDLYLFGMKGKEIWSRYKYGLLMLLALMLLVVAVLYNISSSNVMNGGGKGKIAMSLMGKDTGKGLRQDSSYVGNKMTSGIGRASQYVQERKDTITAYALQIVMALFFIICFLPSVTLFLVIAVSYYVVKPKLIALKSM